MSFGVRLTHEILSAEAGAKTACGIEITHRGESPGQYEVSLDGLDVMWVAIPEPQVTLDPHDSRTELVFLSPPRESESVAGSYPFVARVRNLESGEVRTAQGVLEIKPFHHLSVDIHPKRAVLGPFNPVAETRVTVMNLGNTEHQVQLFATDPDDECAYEFEQERTSVGPGQTKEVTLRVASGKRSIVSPTKLYGFTVTARSVSVPTVAGSTQAQVEKRPLASPGPLMAFLFGLLILLAWVMMIPKPPTVEVFTSDRSTALVGDSVQLEWQSNASTRSVRLLMDGDLVVDNLAPRGKRSVTLNRTGSVRFSVVALSGERVGSTKDVVIEVGSPPTVPDARIVLFEIKPTRQRVGEAFVVRYRVEGATKILLEPTGVQLDPTTSERELTAQRSGRITYRLLAQNSAGKTVSRSFDVTVTDESLAEIVQFEADPAEIDPAVGLIRLTWKITDATRAILAVNGQAQEIDPAGGTKELQLTEATTLTLRAFDSQGKASEKTIKLPVKRPPPPDTTGGTPSTSGDPASTSGNEATPPTTTTGG